MPPSTSRCGKGYQDIFLSQTDRPKGMDYFNFVMSEVGGLCIKELLDGKKEGRNANARLKK